MVPPLPAPKSVYGDLPEEGEGKRGANGVRRCAKHPQLGLCVIEGPVKKLHRTGIYWCPALHTMQFSYPINRLLYPFLKLA